MPGFPATVITWASTRLKSVDLNSQVRDVANYFKGRAGPVTVEDSVTVQGTVSARTLAAPAVIIGPTGGFTAPTATTGESYWAMSYSGAFQTATTGTHPIMGAIKVSKPTITENGAAITATVTLYVENASTQGTDRYAFWVDAGLARLDGDGTHVLELPADATDPTGGGGAAAGRIPVKVGGATRYLAYY